MDNNYIKEENISSAKSDTPPLIYELKTDPVKDGKGRIVEPAVYLDAGDFEDRFARVWSKLTPDQKVAFYLEMERIAALNYESELTGGMYK